MERTEVASALALRGELAAYGETVILRDGGSIGLRAIGPKDRAEVRAFFGRVRASEEAPVVLARK